MNLKNKRLAQLTDQYYSFELAYRFDTYTEDNPSELCRKGELNFIKELVTEILEDYEGNTVQAMEIAEGNVDLIEDYKNIQQLHKALF